MLFAKGKALYLRVSIYILCSKAENDVYISKPSGYTCRLFEVSKCCSTEKEQIFQTIMFLEVDLVFLKVAPPPGLTETFMTHE